MQGWLSGRKWVTVAVLAGYTFVEPRLYWLVGLHSCTAGTMPHPK